MATRPADRTPPPLATDLGLPGEVDTVLRSALSGDPEDRPATAAELAAQLRHLHAELVPTEAGSNASASLPPTLGRGSGGTHDGRATRVVTDQRAAADGRAEAPAVRAVRPDADGPRAASGASAVTEGQSRMSPWVLASSACALAAVLAVTTWLTLSLTLGR